MWDTNLDNQSVVAVTCIPMFHPQTGVSLVVLITKDIRVLSVAVVLARAYLYMTGGGWRKGHYRRHPVTNTYICKHTHSRTYMCTQIYTQRHPHRDRSTHMHNAHTCINIHIHATCELYGSHENQSLIGGEITLYGSDQMGGIKTYLHEDVHDFDQYADVKMVNRGLRSCKRELDRCVDAVIAAVFTL